MPTKIDLQSQRFGRLEVVGPAPNRGRRTAWLCRCDCGKERPVVATHLRKGLTRSCGCAKKDAMKKARDAHKAKAEHNETNSAYSCWRNMLARVGQLGATSYKYVGGRGLGMDPAWRKFRVFLAHIGARPSPTHSIDRIDNDKGYYPGNVRWATPKEQAGNRRDGNITKRLKNLMT